MATHEVQRVYLVGLPGSGKTSAGRRVARLLGWAFVDTDALIETRAGMPIARIFAEWGEARFRALEADVLGDVAGHERAVIATGGGIVSSTANRALMAVSGWRVWLATTPERALARLAAEAAANGESVAARPLLVGDDPRARMAALYEQRQAWYADSDATVSTDELSEDAVAFHIAAGVIARGLLGAPAAQPAVHRVSTPAGTAYDVVVAWGGLAALGERLAALRLPATLHVVSDETVGSLLAPGVLAGLRAAGFEPALWAMPAGEANKNRAQLDALHDWLAERRAERREAVVALGGGVVGDLAGFAAATYLRGVPLVQVPTTLLAQVDSAIGGKVGIDHPRGKNLLGAFHQPVLVVADPAALLTLPSRVYIEGLAEVVKHGVALDDDYFELLERGAATLLARDPATLAEVVAGSVKLKARVVSEDEREGDGGSRQLLNYGHTIGHALETLTGYGEWLHGEAVAVGMAAAARIGLRLGLTPPAVVARQDALLVALGLPVRLPAVSAQALLHIALWDKKVRSGRVQWVLLNGLGKATTSTDVPDAVVREVLIELGATDEPDAARKGYEV